MGLRHYNLSIEDCSKQADGDESRTIANLENLKSSISFALELDENETNALFYVSGYIAKTASDCGGCLNLLCEEKPCPPIAKHAIFFTFIDRGGLKCPSPTWYEISVLAYTAFCEIKASSAALTDLLQAQNAACEFSVLVLLGLNDERPWLLEGECCCHHLWSLLIERCLKRLFNTLAKNVLLIKQSVVQFLIHKKLKNCLLVEFYATIIKKYTKYRVVFCGIFWKNYLMGV